MKMPIKLPVEFEDHPLNSDNRAILRDYVLSSGKGTHMEDKTEMCVNALHGFLLDHTNINAFDDSVCLDFSADCLTYEQYAETEYYHDGSEEYRMIIRFHIISKEQYELFAKSGSKEKSSKYDSMCEIKTKWFKESSDFYFNWFEYTYNYLGKDNKAREFCFFAKDFLNCFDYVRIQCYTQL